MQKRLFILTGPPGSGKTTYAKTYLKGLPVFDTDLGNKHEWESCPSDCVLMTAAPGAKQKTYWLELAKDRGFQPTLYVMWLPRATCVQRMLSRSGKSVLAEDGGVTLPARTQQNNLSSSVERWYKLYSRHQEEQRVDTN